MDKYRIYRAVEILTMKTGADYVVMKHDPDGVLRCVGTGSSIQRIAMEIYFGRLGETKVDEQGRMYTELTSGTL